MFLNVLRDFSRPHWVDIVYEIKGSEGLSVGELGEKLGMSYMGVKQHCVELEKKGYLDTWRRPRKVGRPEKTYRITDKVAPLFPGVGEDFSLSLLRGVKTSQGETAVDRLLYQHFQHESERYREQVKGGDGASTRRVVRQNSLPRRKALRVVDRRPDADRISRSHGAHCRRISERAPS